ncbi:MAG: hypothetical protein ACREP7_15015 [Lysobacter sp.]
MRALAIVACLVLAACTTGQHRGPIAAQCNPVCFDRCVDEQQDTGIRWDADPQDASAFDALAGEVVPALTGKLRTCDVRREACAQCIERLERRGLIVR